MPRQEDEYVYDPLDRQTYEVIAYNAVGRGSEINTLPAYKLTHSTGQSGWSVGLMQWDMGQRGRQHVVPDLMAGYQTWAQEDMRFSDAEVRSLMTRLQTPGQRGNALTAVEQDRINQFLRSDPGREFVNSLDRQQIAYKWDNVGQPLSEIQWLQDLRRTDPAQAAEIVAMASKRFNQGETRGRELIHHLEQNEMTSTELRDWIDTVSARPPANRAALISGRDNALTAVRLVNDLELGDGRLARAWREELHTNGNTGLTQGFSTNPDVQLFDAMMRSPVSGRRILSAIDEEARAQPTVITGINATAQLEMSRVELDRQGTLTVRSPEGVNFEMTADGWNRNGVPMQNQPNPVRADADHVDHMDRGRPPPMPRIEGQDGQQRPPAHDGPDGHPAAPPMRGPGGRNGPDRNGPDQEQGRPPQVPRRAELISDPGFDALAHRTWLQTRGALDRAPIEGLGDLTQHQRERLTANVAARVVGDVQTGMTGVSRIDASTFTNSQTGMPQYVIPGQGDPTTAHYRRIAVDVAQAIDTSVERSSEVAKAGVEAREQKQAQQIAQAQSLNQDGPSGPTMKIGGRTIASSDGGGDGGGGGAG